MAPMSKKRSSSVVEASDPAADAVCEHVTTVVGEAKRQTEASLTAIGTKTDAVVGKIDALEAVLNTGTTDAKLGELGGKFDELQTSLNARAAAATTEGTANAELLQERDRLIHEKLDQLTAAVQRNEKNTEVLVKNMKKLFKFLTEKEE